MSNQLQQFGNVYLPETESSGFCKGVVSAIEVMDGSVSAAQVLNYRSPVYGYHEIVHNKDVSSRFEDLGVIFVDDENQIPDDSLVIPSAHGTGRQVKHSLTLRGCLVIDAVCPLVTHTHIAADDARGAGEFLLYAVEKLPKTDGSMHDEMRGFLGTADHYIDKEGNLVFDPLPKKLVQLEDPFNEIVDFVRDQGFKKVRLATQTTLNDLASIAFGEELGKVFGSVPGFDRLKTAQHGNHVCRAVRDRTDAAMNGAVILRPRRAVVVTDPGSNNGKTYVRALESLAAAEQSLMDVLSVSGPDDPRLLELRSEESVFVTASASTPDETLAAVVGKISGEIMPIPKRPSFKLYHEGRRLTPDNITMIIAEWMSSKAA